MRLLVLGGTKFLGRAVVDAALAGGHEVTLVQSGADESGALSRASRRFVGDRDGDLSALAGREWDAVIDPSGYVPRVVRASAELLRGAVGALRLRLQRSPSTTFRSAPGIDESAPRVSLVGGRPRRSPARSYGGLKVGCEDVVREVFAGAFANVRAGLIVGPHDPTGRFTYWPVRVARGGEVLAPGRSRADQCSSSTCATSARGSCALPRQRVVGDFNATGPSRALSMGVLLETCRVVSGSDAELVWVSRRVPARRRRRARGWSCRSGSRPRRLAFLQVDVSRAVAAGLRFRPLEETVADTLAWAREDGAPGTLASGMAIGDAGMQPEREAELLAAWRAR